MRRSILALCLAGCATTGERFDDSHRALLDESLAKAAPISAGHVWRDAPTFDPRGLVNAYIEIPRGESTKWELDIAKNERFVDRTLPATLGGYPVNYGIVPRAFGYDGDPFDALVLGPPLPGGAFVAGAIVGLMHMDDEKGADPKIVLSPVDDSGAPRFVLDDAERQRIGAWFDVYKDAEPGKWAKVTGWSGPARAKEVLADTLAFFQRGL